MTIPIDPKYYQGHRDIYKAQQFNANVINEDIAPITHLYFDIQCLKDIQLGALLTYIFEDNDHAGYKYIKDNITEYAHRLDRTIMSYFPKLGYTESDIINRINDPKYTDNIVAFSPTTCCYNNLHKILYVVKQRNDHFSGTIPIKIAINIYPLPRFTEVLKNMFYFTLKWLSPVFKLAIIQKPLKDVDINSFKDSKGDLLYKIFFVWNIWESFLSEESKLKDAFTEQMKFVQTQIYSPKKFQVPLSEIDDKERAIKEFDIFLQYFNLCSLFEYTEFDLDLTMLEKV